MLHVPKVSVILVNYNGAQDTIECVQSLSAITYPNYEVIVVDNASTDDSTAVLQAAELPNTVLLCSSENLGFSGGNNVGIRYALEQGTDYILLLNNDTVVAKNFLEPMLEAARQYNNHAAITCKMKYYYKPEKLWYAGGSFSYRTGRTSHWGINKIDRGQYDRQKEVTFVSGCCIMIPERIIRNIGLMAEEYFLYCEDVEYCCRITKYGYKMIYEPLSCIFHKVNASTGKGSNRVTYYTVRNKKYLLKTYTKPKYRILVRFVNLLEIGKRVLTKEYSLPVVRLALSDARNGVFGQKQI